MIDCPSCCFADWTQQQLQSCLGIGASLYRRSLRCRSEG